MMDEYTVETIDLTETTRLRVVYDTSPENPREWGWPVSWHPLHVGRNFDAMPAGVNDLEHRIAEALEWADDTNAAVAKVMRRAGRAFRVVSMGAGRDFVGDYLVYGDSPEVTEGEVEGDISNVQTYLDGEVYGVLLERKHTYADVADPGSTHHHWEVEDSVWGCYLDHEYTAQAVAAEHFGVTIPA